jgi:hypothetical protein
MHSVVEKEKTFSLWASDSWLEEKRLLRPRQIVRWQASFFVAEIG